ncbi:unnamed protein product [Lactuca saligna]|uniref:P-type ATPase C-terminal domain-containing protein n=1 Tax=Lactuca saligna TaxID=75948 RepID=A0AA35VWX5_LACSI|nr:unnamed protein product [Lactuca saligna]
MPRTVEALLDGAAVTKREVSVATVGQCVMSSDFAMAQFRFLVPILLVPGHWNYQRMGYMILYYFYRNAVFVVVLFCMLLHGLDMSEHDGDLEVVSCCVPGILEDMKKFSLQEFLA